MICSFVLLAILLVLVVSFMAVTVLFIPKMIVKTAPEDIKEKVMARPDYSKTKTIFGYFLALLIILCILGVLIYAAVDALNNNFSFSMIFLRFLILFEGYKIFDIICFDWLLLTKSNIFQKLFPETIGCEGYSSFGFSKKSQIIKVILFALISFVISIILSQF